MRAINDWDEEAYFRADAIHGSAKLRDAILRMMGAPVPCGRRPTKPSSKVTYLARKSNTRRKSRRLGSTVRQAALAAQRDREGFIRQLVSGFYRVSIRDLDSPCRRAELVDARHVAMYLTRDIIGRSYPQIGKTFGGRDHTTVIHAERRVKAMCANDTDFADTVQRLKAAASNVIRNWAAAA